MSDEEDTKVSITLRTIVTGPEAGCIIGRGGEVVNSIRDESGAKIKIEGSSQQERIITVDGPTDSIFKVAWKSRIIMSNWTQQHQSSWLEMSVLT